MKEADILDKLAGRRSEAQKAFCKGLKRLSKKRREGNDQTTEIDNIADHSEKTELEGLG